MTEPSTKPEEASAWEPLSYPVFRALWIASVASNIGTWLHDVGAGWLMTSLAPSPLMVALVQAATMLPPFLFALPAGALADIVDRRRFLIGTQLFMMAAAVGLGVLTLLGLTGPWTLLALTFCLGLGTALSAPALQAITPELVPPTSLRPAIALSSVGFNVSRAIGPALGGFLVAFLGPAITFILNSLSFVGLVVVFYRWRREETHSRLASEHFLAAMRTGVRFVRHSPAFKRVLLRAGTYFFFASSTWALLPLLTRQELGGDATTYGILLTCVGAGAVTSAVLLPGVYQRVSSDLIVAGGSLMWAGSIFAVGTLRNLPWVMLALFLGGAAWHAVFSALNTAAQMAVPSWVRARAMAIYLVVFFGAMTAGSTLWGAIATRIGMPGSLALAAAGLAVVAVATSRVHIARHEHLDLSPSMHWPTPVLPDGAEPDRGPVQVTLEYRIAPDDVPLFLELMGEMERSRRRDGALSWALYQDSEDPDIYLETFVAESWTEHLRQHERFTVADREIQDRTYALHQGDRPRVRHMINAYT